MRLKRNVGNMMTCYLNRHTEKQMGEGRGRDSRGFKAQWSLLQHSPIDVFTKKMSTAITQLS